MRSSAGSTPRTSSSGFLPAPGRITAYREPSGPGVRVDSGVVAGSEISGLYDPMIAKLIVHGVDREHARMRMLRALDEFEIGGLPTLLGFHRALLSHPEFIAGGTGHGLVESEELAALAEELTREPAAEAAASNGRVRPRATAVEVGGRRYDVTVLEPEPPWVELARRRREREASGRGGAGSDSVVSPMQGTVLKVDVAAGRRGRGRHRDLRRRGDEDGERDRSAPAGTVTDISVAPGDAVASGQVICRVVADEA